MAEDPRAPDVTDVVSLRAHTALCLLGFRGEGYSPDFIAAMAAVHRRLGEDPAQPVRLTTAPDPLCGACPNLAEQGCTLGGPRHEDHMRAQDEDVLARLGLEAGQTVPWQDVLDRAAAHVTGADLPAICTTCPWLPLGYCAEGLDGLRRETREAGLEP